MKARSVFACAATGIALLAFGATNAAAESANDTFEISPGTVRAGDSVSLSATCDAPDFTAPATIESGALVTTDLTGKKGDDGVWQLTGTTTVQPDAVPGAWSAMFQCGTDFVIAEFRVEPTEIPLAGIEITDNTIRPGQEVKVVGTCEDPRFTSSKIVSPVVTAPDFVREESDSVTTALFSPGRIAADAKPGTYPISFTCVDREITAEFTVVAGKKNPAPVTAQVPVKPKGAADAGSLDQPAAVAGDSTDSSSALLIGVGATALLAAGGAGVWAYRRRQRV